MKFNIFSIFIFAVVSCSSQENTSLKQIDYYAGTRGTSIQLTVSEAGIVYTKNNERSLKTITPNEWKEIELLISEIDIKSIDALIAPSSESASDRALIAYITINTQDTLYETSRFDHGNPPPELKILIDNLYQLIDQ